jgi:CRISPR-associated protein Cmr2
MGEALRHLKGAKGHQAFSVALAGFAGVARRVVEQDCEGLLIYSGGDDVLAFVSVARALKCADELRKAFNACMDIPELEDLPVRPSLSVGLGIGHVLESMSQLLNLGRSAEKLAKGDTPDARGLSRNALGIVLQKRSGAARRWRGNWDNWRVGDIPPKDRQEAMARLEADIKLFASEGLSTRKIHQVQTALERLKPRGRNLPDLTAWKPVLTAEARRILARNDLGLTRDESRRALPPEEVGLHLDGKSWEEVAHEVSAWCDRLLISRAIYEATPSSQRKEVV